MSTALLDALLEQSRQLTLPDQLALAARLIERARQDVAEAIPSERPSWASIEGLFPHPLTGEDAQQWVTRTRRESDKDRGIS